MPARNAKNSFYSYFDVIKHYVEEKYQLVHYELLLDSLYMSKVKDEEWRAKKERAEELYKETKSLVEFLSHLMEEFETKKESSA